VFPVEISLSPLKTAEGVLVTAAIRDISERKRVEGQIHKLNLQLQAKDQLQLLLDSTAEAIYSIDVDGACTLCNAACLRLLGYSRDSELLAKNMHALMHHTRPDGRAYPEEECKILQAFRQGKGAHVTDEVLWRADGTSFPAEYWSYPVRHDGRMVGSVVTFFDITERKKSEEAPRRSESRYRSMIESAPYGIFCVDQNGCVAMANSALAAMLGTKFQTRSWASTWVRTFISIRWSSNALVIMHPKIPRLVTRPSGNGKRPRRTQGAEEGCHHKEHSRDRPRGTFRTNQGRAIK
jgi:PAS domain S-box-containing protein